MLLQLLSVVLDWCSSSVIGGEIYYLIWRHTTPKSQTGSELQKLPHSLQIFVQFPPKYIGPLPDPGCTKASLKKGTHAICPPCSVFCCRGCLPTCVRLAWRRSSSFKHHCAGNIKVQQKLACSLPANSSVAQGCLLSGWKTKLDFLSCINYQKLAFVCVSDISQIIPDHSLVGLCWWYHSELLL